MNPFSRDIVKNPLELPVTVPSLNRAVLDGLTSALAPLTAPGRPRPAIPATKAQLILSPSPGYGKSHLIARLTADLAGRATVISFTPFQSAGLCWQSLLLQLVKALQTQVPASTPLGGGTLGNGSHTTGKTRLSAFSEDVIRHLLAQALRDGLLSHPQPAEAERWALNHLTIWPPDYRKDWNPWLHETFLSQTANWRSILTSHDIHLTDEDWLPVLFRYAASDVFTAPQQQCLSWFRGQTLSDGTRTELGLSPDTAAPETPGVEELNDRCRQRFHDFCRLAAFHRPFVFCFDQTEVFAQNSTLALTFGRVIAELVNEVPHHMTVVTTNQAIWEKKIFPCMEQADVQRFQAGVALKGLCRAEAGELITLLTHSQAGQTDQSDQPNHDAPLARVTDPAWLRSLFPAESTEIPAREFLQTCQRCWDGQVAAAPEPPPSVEQLYQNRIHAASAQPPAYDPDVFRWLTRDVLPLPGEAGTVDHPEALAEIIWTLPGRATVRFSFAHSTFDSYAIWRRLAEYAQQNERRDAVPVSKLILFRTPEIQSCPIPKDSWKKNGPAIQTARNTCLQLIELTAQETAALAAARQLHLEAESGDLEGHPGQDVLHFLTKKLSTWRDRLLAPLTSFNPVPGQSDPAPGGPRPPDKILTTPPIKEPPSLSNSASVPAPNDNTIHQPIPIPAHLPDRIRQILRTEKFLGIDSLVSKLGGGISPDLALTACRSIPEIECQNFNSCTILLWQA